MDNKKIPVIVYDWIDDIEEIEANSRYEIMPAYWVIDRYVDGGGYWTWVFDDAVENQQEQTLSTHPLVYGTIKEAKQTAKSMGWKVVSDA